MLRHVMRSVLLSGVGALALNVSSSTSSYAQAYTGDPGRANDPASWMTSEFSSNWGLERIKAHYAYALGFTGKNVKLGIFDSGVFVKHPELVKSIGLITSGIRTVTVDKRSLGSPERPAGAAFTLNGGVPYIDSVDSGGFIEESGTQLGGIIAAQRNGTGMHGVAYNSQLFSVQNDNDYLLKDSAIFAAGIDTLIAQGVRAISVQDVALSSYMSDPRELRKLTDGDVGSFPEILTNFKTLERATKAGITVVMGLGINPFGSGPHLNPYAYLPFYQPESEENYLSVLSISKDPENAFRYELGGPKKDVISTCKFASFWCVSAPGIDTNTTSVTGTDESNMVATYNEKLGLSTATGTAHVAGALGILAERFSYMDPKHTRVVMMTTADHLSFKSDDDGKVSYVIDNSVKVPDEAFGWGLINLERAMDGPGQFLGNFDITMPEGIYDIWKNDISDEAIKARYAEDKKEHDAFAAVNRDNGWTLGSPVGLDETKKAEYARDLARYRAFENRQWFGSLTKRGNGVLTLQGANSYTGPTRVVEGTLDLHGKTGAGSFGQLKGDVIVDTAGRLQGDANLGGNLTISGTIAPGDTIAVIDNKPVAVAGIGTINVAGNYVQAAGSLYRVDVDPGNTAADHINVAGSATIDSGASVALNKTRDLPFIPGTRYTIMTAATVSGAYNPKMITAFLEAKLAYDAQHAYIDIEQTRKFVASGKTPNEIATAAGLQSTRPSNGLNIAFANLSDDITARAALNQLSGEIHASVKSALIEDSWIPREAAFGRLRQSFGAGSAAMRPVADAISEHGFFEGTALWGQILGSRGTNRGDGNAEKITHKTGGFMMGIDKALGSATMPWRAGVMAGYSRSSFDVASGRNSSAKANNYHVGLYAGTQWNNLALRLGGAYSFHKIKTKRSVAFAGYSDYLTGSYKARTLQLFGELGYRIDVSERLSFEPFANIAHIRLHTKAFKETGGLAALSAGKETTKTTFSTLGLRAEMAMGSSENPLKVRLMAGWRHAFGTLKAKSLLAFSSSDAFQIAGAPIAKNAFVGGIGFDMNLSQQVRFSFDYSAQLAKKAHDHRFQGGLTINF